MSEMSPAAERDTPWHRMPSVLALLAAHLVPLAGVLFAHWPIYPLMLMFWAENVIVGLYTVPKIILACADPPELGPGERPDKFSETLTPTTYPLFFVCHYGTFALVHFLVLYGIFGTPDVGKEMQHVAPDRLLATMFEQLSRSGLLLGVIALAASHGVSFWTNYVQPQRYLDVSKKEAMMAPYGRVILLHLVLIGGAFAIQRIGPGPLPLVVLILVKTGMDLVAHLKEHRDALGVDVRDAIISEVPLAEALAEINDRPLDHFLGSWRLAPDQAGAVDWCTGVVFSQNCGQVHLRLADNGAPGSAPDATAGVQVRGDADRIEYIEARLRGAGRERILRFSASGERDDRIDLTEIQQPEGRPREMQARTSSFARAEMRRIPVPDPGGAGPGPATRN
jgi:hypothetical protein